MIDQEAIEIMKKRIDELENKANYHKRKMEDLEAEIWRTQLAIDRMKKNETTITDFQSAKELHQEKVIHEALDKEA